MGTSGENFNGDFTDRSGEWTVTVSELVFFPEPSEQNTGIQIHPASDTKRLAGPWVFHLQVP